MSDSIFQQAWVMSQKGEHKNAISLYQKHIDENPSDADAYYNLAFLYKHSRDFSEAIFNYHKAIELGASKQQEIYTNLGVIYAELNQYDEAQANYRTALRIDANYVPAMFNLGGLQEEHGQKDKARDIYNQILKISPGYSEALVRLAYLDKNNLIVEKKIRRTLRRSNLEVPQKESLLYSLAKICDDRQSYDEALANLDEANQLSRSRVGDYNPEHFVQLMNDICDSFETNLVQIQKAERTESPFFICGMFRSGSTLLEQLLARHKQITAAGELDFFPQLAFKTPWWKPENYINGEQQLSQLAQDYLKDCRSRFPGADYLIDKRPDNFLYLGLILTIFPNAKILHTRRDPRDNAVSILGQQLSNKFVYANQVDSIQHYQSLEQEIINFWKRKFPRNILTVDYEQLIANPETSLERIFEFLQLSSPQNLVDRPRQQVVKTASLWQVREPLHARSIGRWRNYSSLFEK
ncbi:MAG: sulfotransferase [Kangiellaceae bacterium]|nr:sulfotransferase [Kangiellaceae bacterium]MCW8997399.1 sulfotransferase [Kangiellaceae bacterium]